MFHCPNNMGIPRSVTIAVWEKHAGKCYETKCSCCKKASVTAVDFYVSRLIPQAKGTKDDLSNLVPVCKDCHHKSADCGVARLIESSSTKVPVSDICISLRSLEASELAQVTSFIASLATDGTVTLVHRTSEATGLCKNVHSGGRRVGKVCDRKIFNGADMCSSCVRYNKSGSSSVSSSTGSLPVVNSLPSFADHA